MKSAAIPKTRLNWSETLGVMSVLAERNFRLMTRFSVSTLMFYIGVFADAAISAFLGTALIGEAKAAQIGGDYVSYVIVGLAYSQLMYTSINAPLHSLAGAYWSARLEPLLRAPLPLRTIILADALYYYLMDLVTVAIYAFVGILFGMSIPSPGAILPAAGILMLGCVSVLGFGFLSASMFNLINAKAPGGNSEPVQWLVRTLQRLVCGVYFPVTALPRWLQKIGNFMPQTYVLDSVRRLLIPNYPKGPTLPVHSSFGLDPQVANLVVIVVLTAIILPLGLWAFDMGLEKARKDGGLSRWT